MASKQKHQQQQQQMRASRTMPQLNYTEADIQEQYLSTMGVRVPSQRSPASVEGQANNSRRPRGTSDGQPPVASSSSGRLGGGDTVADQQHESLRWRRSQQLAKFDDSAAPSDEYDDMPADDNGQFRSSTRGNAGAHSSGDRVGGFNDQDGQTAELENVRPTRSTSSSKLGDSDGGGGGGIKRKRRSRSASRLLSACLNIPAQLASSISSHHQQLQTAAHKTKASSILSHFRIGHHHHHNHNQNHHQNQNQHGVHMNHENGPQQTDEDYPQMGGAGQHDINRRPLSNSRTLGDLKSTSHLQFQDSSQESPSGGAGGAGMGHPRMKHVSFGEHQNQQQQQQQQQQQALLQATNETQQNNVIAAGALGVNSRQTKQQPTTDGGPQVADMQPAHHLAAGGGGQAAVQPHQNQRRPPGGAGPTNSQTARLSQPAPISRQPAPLASGPASHHQVPGSPHFKQPLQHAIGVRQQHQQQQQMQLQQNQTSNTIYKRLPNVPMRTQATQTEITAYHLVASPSGQSSVGSCSLAGTLTRNPQSADLGGTRRQTTTSGTLATAASLQGGELDSASVRLGAGADTPSSSQASATTTLAPATSASGNQTPVISSQKSISASSSDQQQHQQHGQQQQQTCQNDNQQPDGELQQQRRRRRRPGTGDDDDYEEDELMAGSSDINKVTATDEEETELELGQSLRATLLNSSSNSSSSVSLVGHDLALADTLKCDLRIGTSAPVLVDDAGDDDAEKLRPVGEGPAVGGAAPSSSPPPPIQSHRTSIIKPATGPTTLTDSKAMPTTSTITTMMKKTSATATKGAPSAVAEANNNNNNKLANDDEMSSSSLLNNRERRGRQREEIEPPNKFKDAGGGQAPATNKTFAAAQEQQQKPNASSSTTTSGGQTLVVNTAAGMPVGTKEAMLMDHDHQDHGHGYAHGHERPLRDNDGPNDGPNDDEEEDDDDEARTSPPSLSEASSQTEASMASAHMLDRIGRALERQASSSRAPGGPNRRSSAAAAVAVAGARQQQQTQHHYHHQQRRQISVDNDARLLRAAHLGSIQQPEDRGTAAAAGTQNYGLASSETTVGGRLATQDSSSRSRPDPYAAVPVSQQQWQASRIDLQQQQKQQQQPPPPSMPTGRPVKSEKLGGGEAVTTSTTTTMTKTGEGHHHGADDEGTALEAEEAPQPATTAKQTNGTNQRAPSGPAVDRSDSVTIPKSLYNQSTVQEPAASSLLAAKTIVQHTETEEATEEERKRYRGEPAAPPPSAIIMHDAGGPSVGPVAAAAEAGGGPRSQTTVSSSSAAALQRRDHFLTGSSSQGLSLDSDDKSLERMTTTAASGELLSLATLDDDEDDGGGDEAALGTSAAAVGDLRHDSDELLDVAKLTERQLADHQIQLAVSQAIVGRGASQATTTSTLSTRHHSYCSTDGFQSHDRAELDLVGPGGGGSVSGADLYTNRLEDDDDDGDDNGEQEHENGDIQNEEAEDDDENGEQDEEASDEFVVLSGRQLSKDQGREQERATMVVAPDAASTVELTELATTKTATIATTDEIAAAAADAIRHGDLSDTSSTSSSCASGQTLKSTRRRSSSSLRVALTKGNDDEPSGNDDGSTKAAPSSSIGGENPTSLLVGAPSGKTPATSSSLGEHELANQSGAGLVVVSGGGGERVEEEEADEGKEVKEEGARNRGDTTTTVSEWPANGPNKGPTNGAALAEAANDDNAKRAERICAVVSEQRQTQQSPGRSGAINLHDDDTAATTTSKSTLAHKMPTTTTKTTLNKNERNAGAEPGLVAGLDAEQGRDGDKGGRQEGPESLKELGQHQPSRSSPSLSSSSSSSSSSASSSRRTHSKSSKSSSSAGSSSSSSSSSCSSARSAAPRRSSSSKLTPATSKQQPAIPSEPLEKPSVPTKQPKQQLESSVGGADGDGDKIAQATTSAAASLERKTSSPSPPTTVSDLDQDEELSTPSFVDTYKRRLEDHVNELADSFSATLIDEGLAAAAAAAVRDEVEDEDEERNSDNNNKRANEPELLGPQNVIGTSAGPGSTTVVPSQAVSLSRSSSSSSTSTTSAGGSSYVRLESGRLERRSKARLSQTNAASQEQQQQQQSSAKPELPKKPAHLVVVAPTLAHHHQAGAPLASQSRVQPQSEFSSNLQDDHHGERATAVAVTATSIAAARAMHANGKSTTPSTLAAATTTTTTPTTTTLDIDLKAARRQDGRREEAVAQVRRETSATQATTIRQASVDSGRRKPPRYTTKAASMDQTMEPVSAGGIGAGDDSRKPIRIDRSSSSDGQQQQPPSSRRAVQFVTHTEPVKQEPIKEANETPPGSQEQKAGQSGSSPGTPPSDDLHHQVASSATGKEPPSPVEHQSGQLGRATVQVVPSLADRQSPSSSCLAPTANQQLVRTGQPSANSAEGDIYDNDESGDGDELDEAAAAAIAASKLVAGHENSGAGEQLDAGEQSPVELSTVSEASDELLSGSVSSSAKQQLSSASGSSMGAATGAGDSRHEGPSAQLDAGVQVSSQAAPVGPAAVTTAKTPAASLIRQLSSGSFESRASSASQTPPPASQAQAVGAAAANRAQRHSLISGEQPGGSPLKLQHPSSGTIKTGQSQLQARSSPPVDCPYVTTMTTPAKITTEKRPSVGAAATAGHHLVSGGPAASGTPSVDGAGAAAAASAAITSPNNSSSAASSQATAPTQPPISNSATPNFPSKRLSHDDTMEAIEDDVEGEEQEMKLLDELRQQQRLTGQQSPANIAPPAGFCSGPHPLLGATSRPSSSLGGPSPVSGQSIQEEDEDEEEEEGENKPGPAHLADTETSATTTTTTAESRGKVEHSSGEEDDEDEEEDEESSISVSQKHGVVVTTTTQVESSSSRRARSTCSPGRFDNTKDKSSIRMKRFKRSSSNSSSSSSSSMGDGSNRATPMVSSPTSSPSKSSQADSTGSATISSTRSPADSPKTGSPARGAEDNDSQSDNQSESQRELLLKTPTREHPNSNNDLVTGKGTSPPKANEHELPLPTSYSSMPETVGDEIHSHLKQQQQQSAAGPLTGHGEQSKLAGKTTATASSTASTTTSHSHSHSGDSTESATHAILEHLSRHHHPGSLASGMAHLDEPAPSLELCRSIDPQQRRASWLRESETSRGASSTNGASPVRSQTAATSSGSSTTAEHSVNAGRPVVVSGSSRQAGPEGEHQHPASGTATASTTTVTRNKGGHVEGTTATTATDGAAGVGRGVGVDVDAGDHVDVVEPHLPASFIDSPSRTGTMKRRRNEPAAAPEAPGAAATTTTNRNRQVDSMPTTAATAVEMDSAAPIGAKPDPSQARSSGLVASVTAETGAAVNPAASGDQAPAKRPPPLGKLKSPQTADDQQQQQPQQQLQQQQQQSSSLDRADVDGSICSSCSCMDASFDQTIAAREPMPQISEVTPSTSRQQQQQSQQQQQRQQQQQKQQQQQRGSLASASSSWMSQEEGTVFTENYWLSHWLYISEHEEAEIWKRAIDLGRSSGGGGGASQEPGGSEKQQRQKVARDATAVAAAGSRARARLEAGLPEDMSETASTTSERTFNTRYKSTTRKMIHRRASIEMFKRIMANNLKKEKRVEISRSSVGEFGFRIHGSRPVVVSAIERGTSAETCGLQVGDLIYAINDTNILDMAHSDVVRLAHDAGSSALILDLIPTNGFLQSTRYSRRENKRYEPTVTGYLMRLSPSTAQPLLIELQERMSSGGSASGSGHGNSAAATSQQRAIELNKVMRLAWRARYFVLRSDNCLYWYKSPDEMVEPHGGLNLQGFSATLTDEFSEPDYVIRLVKYGGQPHYLGSNNMCDIQTWVDAINRAATEANQNDPYMKRTLVLARGKPNQIEEPDCSGWLYKFSHKRGGGAHWRAAYFVLKDACLYLFRNQKAELVEQASAVYYLHGYRVRSKHIEHKKHTFELIPPNRKTIKPMFLMASNEIDKKRWIAALEYSIDRWIEIN